MRLGFTALGAMCFALVGCTESGPPSATYLLVDISSSTNSERIRSQTRSDFERVLSEWSTAGGILRGDGIGGDTLNQSTVPIRASIPAFNLAKMITSDEEYHKKKIVAPALEEARKQFEQVLATKPAVSTEILSALTVAAKTFNGEECHEAKHKALVIFSDMVEESKLVNFQHDSLTDKRIEEIISAERKAGRLPLLTGVRVWKAGSATSQIDDSKVRQIEKFWTQYFSATGADLKTERYGAALQDFTLKW
jgi:hypothetical protein